MGKSSKFVSNTIILSIGTVAAKMIQYLLLPYYTNVLNTSQYGIVDNLQNIATLLIPIISMTISESIFRYAMDNSYEKKKVFSNGIIIDMIGMLMAIVFVGVSLLFIDDNKLKNYVIIIIVYVGLNIFRTNCSMFVKAMNKTVLFTVDNVVLALVTVISNIFFLSVIDLGIIGYMLGYIVGNLVSMVFLVCKAQLFKFFSFGLFSKKICKIMLIFCIPLIPNTICWWISNCSDRFMITYYLGESANGLYAIAYKIPTIMTILIGIFLQAWQISANEASEDLKINEYYTKMYHYLDTFVMAMGTVVILMSNLLIRFMVNEAFYEAWKYVPVLVFAICFYSKAQLLGTVYTTFKKTNMAFITNLIASIVNIIGNVILINAMGVIGAAVATAFSYVVLFYLRKFDTTRQVAIGYSEVNEHISMLLLFIEVVIYTVFPQYLWIACVCAVSIIVLKRTVIVELMQKILSLVRK